MRRRQSQTTRPGCTLPQVRGEEKRTPTAAACKPRHVPASLPAAARNRATQQQRLTGCGAALLPLRAGVPAQVEAPTVTIDDNGAVTAQFAASSPDAAMFYELLLTPEGSQPPAATVGTIPAGAIAWNDASIAGGSYAFNGVAAGEYRLVVRCVRGSWGAGCGAGRLTSPCVLATCAQQQRAKRLHACNLPQQRSCAQGARPVSLSPCLRAGATTSWALQPRLPPWCWWASPASPANPC